MARPQLERLIEAKRAADAAGNTEDSEYLAGRIRELGAQQTYQPTGEQVSESQIPVSQEQFDQARQQFQSVFPERSDQTPQQPSRSGIGERFLQSQRELAFTPRPDQPMDPRAAIAFRALNSLLLGAPAAFNENYSELVQAAGEDSRIASAIGDIAGFLVPGGLALKGVKGVAGRAGLAGGGRVTQAGVGGAAALGEGALYAGTVDPTTRGEMPSLAAAGEFLSDPIMAPVTAALGSAAGAFRRGVDAPEALSRRDEAMASVDLTQAQGITPDEQQTYQRMFQRAAAGNSQAQQQLAREARTNPELIQMAEDMGIDMPIEAIVEDKTVQSVLTALKNTETSPAQITFNAKVEAAVKRADEIMEELGASVDLSQISQNVLDAMKNTQTSLLSQARNLYKQVDVDVPRNTIVEGRETINVLQKKADELRGVDRLSRGERDLLKQMQSGTYTREAVKREKGKLQQTVFAKEDPFMGVDKFDKIKLISALREDELDAIRRVGGEDAAERTEAAWAATAKQKSLESQIVNAFGKDLEGSVAAKINSALLSGAKGDITNINKILDLIPKELRGEVLLSSIMNLSRGKTEKGVDQFNFSNFSKFMKQLNQQSAVRDRVMVELPAGVPQTLNNLARLSNRINAAQAAGSKTGASLYPQIQEIIDNLNSERLLVRFMKSPLVRGAAVGAAAGTLDPAAGAALGTLVAALQKSPVNTRDELNKLIATPKFQQLMISVATQPRTRSEVIRDLAKTPEYQSWAQVSGIKNPDSWLTGAVAAVQAVDQRDTTGGPEGAPRGLTVSLPTQGGSGMRDGQPIQGQ